MKEVELKKELKELKSEIEYIKYKMELYRLIAAKDWRSALIQHSTPPRA